VDWNEVERIEYADDVWSLQVPHAALADFLAARDCLIVLQRGEAPPRVVLGVPHQAAVGEDCICEKRPGDDGRLRPRDSDENAASYALVAYSKLMASGVPCKLVIMAHPSRHDPNKRLDSPYSREVFACEPSLVLECHGAGAHRRLSLELSAGQNTLSDTVRFGRALAVGLGHRYSLGIQRQAGTRHALILAVGGGEEYGQLQRGALKTPVLREAGRRGIHALHLEAKPAFRKPADGTNTVTPDGLLLGRAIAQAIIQYFSQTQPLADSGIDTFIELPHGGAGAGFHVSELVSHVRSTGRDYIIQGQQKCTLANHTKPQSLDVWLRRRFPSRQDIKQADNDVVDALVATGLFQVIKGLRCPDSGRRVKGLLLVDPTQ